MIYSISLIKFLLKGIHTIVPLTRKDIRIIQIGINEQIASQYDNYILDIEEEDDGVYIGTLKDNEDIVVCTMSFEETNIKLILNDSLAASLDGVSVTRTAELEEMIVIVNQVIMLLSFYITQRVNDYTFDVSNIEEVDNEDGGGMDSIDSGINSFYSHLLKNIEKDMPDFDDDGDFSAKAIKLDVTDMSEQDAVELLRQSLTDMGIDVDSTNLDEIVSEAMGSIPQEYEEEYEEESSEDSEGCDTDEDEWI